jgi:hypothetical protein
MSLLEVMVSFSILILVFVTLTQAFPLALTIIKTAENATKASYLAQAKLEELNSLGYGNIGIGTVEAKHRLSSDQANYLYYFQREAIINYVDGNLQASALDTGLKKITVTVYYGYALSKTERSYSTFALINQW